MYKLTAESSKEIGELPEIISKIGLSVTLESDVKHKLTAQYIQNTLILNMICAVNDQFLSQVVLKTKSFKNVIMNAKEKLKIIKNAEIIHGFSCCTDIKINKENMYSCLRNKKFAKKEINIAY